MPSSQKIIIIHLTLTAANYMILQVLKYEPEWSVTYEDVLVYLKESYAMMIVNLKYIAL